MADNSIVLWLFGLVFIASAFGALWMQSYALRRQLYDIPNSRSAHARPTPRGGGVAIVVSFLVGFSGLFFLDRVPLDFFIALSGGGLLVAAISCWDDYRSLSVRLRIAVHFIAAVWAFYWLGGMAPLDLGFAVWSWGWFRQVVGIIGLVWLINLYNFMDGIDGIAAAEAIFVSLAIVFLLGSDSDLSISLGLLAASCGGFLVLNWAPARIFMGDTGSCFLGFVFGVTAIATAARTSLPIWCWVIVLAVFIVDASVTLGQRIIAGERWYDAHCTHVYQRLRRRWNSHLRVMLAVLAINICWLFPLAYFALKFRDWAFVIALLALVPMIWGAAYLGAGRQIDNG